MLSLRQVSRPTILATLALAAALTLATAAFGAPSLSIVSGPEGPTTDSTPSFGFEVDPGTTVECSIDAGTPDYGACDSDSGHAAAGPLADGDYVFRVRATDSVPEQSEATRAFTVDTVDPALSILSGPDGPTSDDAPDFGFQAEDGTTVECSVDQGTPNWAACSGATSHSPTTLTDGSYVFRVRATDPAGNVTTRTRGFSVDTVAPTTTIDSTPLGTTDDQTPSFEFSADEGGVTFECRFDGPSFSSCSSPRSYGPLAEGDHSFAVRAVDAAGNVGDEDLESFAVDLTNPTLAIVDGPDGATNDSTPRWSFDAENGTAVECSVDQGTPTWGPCDDGGSHAAGPLADGAYAFRVRATDGAGHTTVESWVFVVDTIAPTATVASGPGGPTNDTSPAFGLASNEAGVSFECRLDSATFAPCETPKAYSSLAQGAHTFAVRATDAAGNVGSAAVAEFSIDTVAPSVAVSFGPTGTTTDDSPLFEFVASGHSRAECSIDQGTPLWGPCTSATAHVVTSRLPNGSYSFRVRVFDPAGNGATATRSFAVATGGPPTTPSQPTPTAAAAPRLMSPFPLVRLSGRLTPTGAKVQILTVRARSGARVQIRIQPRCAKPARCRAKLSGETIGAKGTVRFRRLEIAYRAGTTIEVLVSKPGAIGKYTRFTVRRGKAPKRVDRCLMPGATRGSACPVV